jgi:hypothetical protein
MLAPPPTTPLPEEVRQELQDLAAEAERRNRPRTLVVLGIALLMAALGYVVWAALARASAAEDLERRRQQAEDVRRRADEVVSLRTHQEQTLAQDRFAPDPRLAAKLEDLAREVGMIDTKVEERPDTSIEATRVPNFSRRAYTLRFRNTAQPTAAVLSFLERSQGLAPGLEAQSIILEPGRMLTQEGQTTVTGELVFVRWQRAGQ